MVHQYSNEEEFRIVCTYLDTRIQTRKEHGRVPKGTRDLEKDVLLYIGKENSEGNDPFTAEIAEGLGMKRGAANISNLVHRINWAKPQKIDKIRDKRNVRHRLTQKGWEAYHIYAKTLFY